MPIQVACSDCGKRYRFADDRAGETVECKECGSEVEIPGGRSRSGNSGGKKKKKKQNSGAGTGLLIGGGVGAVVLVGLIFLMSRGPGPLPAPPANAPVENNAQPVAVNPAPPANNAAPTNPAAPGAMLPNAAAGPLNPAAPAVAANPAAPAAKGPAAASGFNKTQDTMGFKPVKDWKVEVDPPAEPLAMDDVKKFNIKTVDGYLQSNFVTYPETPSPFVLVGQNGSNKESREVWNLVTGAKEGAVKGPRISGNNIGFSPDGAYVAWFRHEGTGGGVEVYDIKAKKSLGALAVDSNKFNVGRVCLPTSKRVVALSNVHRGILTWKLPSGDLEWQITMGEKGQPEPRQAFSPGGRFLAVVSDFLAKSVDIYDLDKGEKAGSIEFAANSTNDLLGMAFSRDGKELAAAYGQSYTDKSQRIVIWNAATGAVASDFELPNLDQKKLDMLSSKTSLQWFPDGKRLLLNGTSVIDRESKTIVFEFPKQSLDFHTALTRRVLSDTQIASWDGTNKSAIISPLELKAEEIARAKEVAAAGGLMFDAKLPKLTAFQRDKAADRSKVDAAWKAAADPAPSEGKLAANVPLKSGNGRARELELSRPDAGIICVRMTDDEDNSQAAISGLIPRTHLVTGNNRSRIRIRIPPVPCQKNWLELYDGVKRAPAGRIDIDFPCELMAVSPNGTRVLVQAIDGDGRLDVFGADGQHIAGCRPFQDESEKQKREIVSAVFLDENTVAACSLDDHLIAFRLPTCEPVFAVDDAGTLAVSPGGKLIATCADKKVELRDAVTGEGRGSVPLEADVQAISFSPKGDRLAVLTVGRTGTAVVLVDLASGSTTSVPTPQGVAPLIWCGDNEVMIGSPNTSELISTRKGVNVDRALMLVDLSRKAVLWSYIYGTQDDVSFGQRSSDGRFWLVGASAKGKAGQITAIALPDAATKKFATDKKFDAQALVKPGASIALKFEVLSPAGIEGYAQKARAFVEEAIKSNELTIKESAPVQLVVTIATGNATGNITLQALGGFGGQKPPDITVQRKAAVVRVAYESGGKAVWESKHDLSNDFFGITRLPEGKDAQTVLDENMWQRALSILEKNQPPTHVFSAESARGLGTSRLAGDGTHPVGK